jgi:hypothetical protein
MNNKEANMELLCCLLPYCLFADLLRSDSDTVPVLSDCEAWVIWIVFSSQPVAEIRKLALRKLLRKLVLVDLPFVLISKKHKDVTVLDSLEHYWILNTLKFIIVF